MGLGTETLERQLSRAKSELEACESQLSETGVDAKSYKRNPNWRKLNANHSRLKARVEAAKAVETLSEEVAARKAAKDSEE